MAGRHHPPKQNNRKQQRPSGPTKKDEAPAIVPVVGTSHSEKAEDRVEDQQTDTGQERQERWWWTWLKEGDRIWKFLAFVVATLLVVVGLIVARSGSKAEIKSADFAEKQWRSEAPALLGTPKIRVDFENDKLFLVFSNSGKLQGSGFEIEVGEARFPWGEAPKPSDWHAHIIKKYSAPIPVGTDSFTVEVPIEGLTPEEKARLKAEEIAWMVAAYVKYSNGIEGEAKSTLNFSLGHHSANGVSSWDNMSMPNTPEEVEEIKKAHPDVRVIPMWDRAQTQLAK